MRLLLSVFGLAAIVCGGCARAEPPRDDTAFRAAKPATLLVLPPLNDSTDVNATAAVWAQATRPLAEAGYYVLPVATVEAMFRENGVTTAADAASLPYQKLREVFGADAAVYMRVRRYGTVYAVVDSQTTVDVEGTIVDLRDGTELWAGSACAVSSQNSGGGGLLGALVFAVVHQVVDVSTDAAFTVAGRADWNLLGPRRHNGVLPGPRMPVVADPTTAAH